MLRTPRVASLSRRLRNATAYHACSYSSSVPWQSNQSDRRAQVVGVVREAYGIWERRAPLGPEHVQQLVSRGWRVQVQPSSRRIFSDSEYVAAGAEVTEVDARGAEPADLPELAGALAGAQAAEEANANPYGMLPPVLQPQ